MSERMKVELGDGKYLVADTYPGAEYREIYIYICDDSDVVIQDLACVRQKYEYDADDCVHHIDGLFEVLLWRNEYSEDYTDKFEIREYKEHDDTEGVA